MCLTLLIPFVYLVACFLSGSLSIEPFWLIASFMVGFFLDLVWIGIVALAD